MKNSISLKTIKNSRGFGLLEMILVFILVISASAVVANMFLSARPTVQASNASQNLTTIAANLQGVWGVHNDYADVTTQAAIDAHAIPESMVSGSNAIFSLWSGSINVAGSNGATNPAAATNEVNITYAGVPGEACVKFVTSASAFFEDVTVGGTTVFANNQLDPGVLVTQCASGAAGEVEIVFTAV